MDNPENKIQKSEQEKLERSSSTIEILDHIRSTSLTYSILFAIIAFVGAISGYIITSIILGFAGIALTLSINSIRKRNIQANIQARLKQKESEEIEKLRE